jgi:hypothetical protein
MTIRYNIGSLVYVDCAHFAYFSRFGMFGPRKIWQPFLRTGDSNTFPLRSVLQRWS